IHYARSLPITKALDGNVMLAYKMNGQELTQAHGFPLRALVPGWYAMASVKWLTRVIVTDKAFGGYFQTIDYAYWHDGPDGIERVPITKMQLKAEIARPQLKEVLDANKDYEVFGACWTGEANVARVEVSTDNGK